MKYLSILLFFIPFIVFGQNVGIGTPSPHASAKLEVQSTSGGVLIPRLTTQERNDIPTPIASGLLIYNSENTRFEFWNGTAWGPIASATSGGSSITDADGDTKVDVEMSADEDTIRMSVKNNEILKIDQQTVHINAENKGTLIGLNAGKNLPLSDSWNTILGYRAGEETNSGITNTIIGAYAGSKGNKGSSNTFLGGLSGQESTGDNNTYIGVQAGQKSGNSSDNNYIGVNAGAQNTGSQNISIGHFSSYFGSGNNNIGIGRYSLFSPGNNVSGLVAIGDSTLYRSGQLSTFPFQGINNTAVGSKALKKNNQGLNNTAVGNNTLENNTSGANNTSLGSSAGNSNTNGVGNTSIGSLSLLSNTTGDFNVSIGYEAGRFSGGNRNTFIGYASGASNFIGSGNTFIGHRAGEFETGNDKLYIHNSASPTPLIYGDFANDSLHLNGITRINQSYDLPSEDGLLGQVLNTNGAGQLSWSSGNPCETRIPIDSIPFTIDEPGSYYLTKNLTYIIAGSGITVDTNNVTLDLNGFTLYGTTGSFNGPTRNGIVINGNNNTISNGVLNGWTYGINFQGDNNHIKNCRLYKCLGGLLVSGTGNLIEHCTISFNSLWGIKLGGSRHVIQYNILDNNNPFAQSPFIQGIPAAVVASGNATFFRNQMNNNGSYGFLVSGICLLEENQVQNTIGNSSFAYYFTGSGSNGAMLNNKGFQNITNVGGTTPPTDRMIGNLFW